MRTLRLQISLLWLSLALFVIVEMVLLYAYHHSDKHWQDTIVFGASVVAGAFALFSYMKNIEEKRRGAASRIIERWNDSAMRPYRDVMRDIRADRQSLQPLMRLSREHAFDQNTYEIRSKMQALLGFFEDACLAIRLADETFLQLYFAAVVMQSYKKTRPWIENERKIDDEANYYREFETVARRWIAKVEKAHFG